MVDPTVRVSGEEYPLGLVKTILGWVAKAVQMALFAILYSKEKVFNYFGMPMPSWA